MLLDPNLESFRIRDTDTGNYFLISVVEQEILAGAGANLKVRLQLGDDKKNPKPVKNELAPQHGPHPRERSHIPRSRDQLATS